MPAFTFEKISPPDRRGPVPPIMEKPRGLILQMLDSFVAALKSGMRDKNAAGRRDRKPSD